MRLALSGVLLASAVGAQQPTRVVPGNGQLALDRLEPFEAEYTQFGASMHVRLAREATDAGSWSFTMENAGPAGTAVDHVVHSWEGLSFERRHFGFGAFADEYLEVETSEEVLRVRRLVRGPAQGSAPVEYPLSEPVIDGTFLYWTLGLLSLDVGRTFTFPTWSPTADGARLRESGTLRVMGREDFDAGSAGIVGATVIEAEAGTGRVRMIVVPHAPYLLRQEAIDAEGDTTVIVEVRSMRRPVVEADARNAITRSSARFSRAYMEGDTDAVRALYTEDGRLLPPGSVVRGREAIGSFFAPNPRRATLEHRMESESLTIHGDYAIDVGMWEQRVRSEPEGAISTASERYLIVWRRQLDGVWRIAEDMWHRPPATPGGN